MKQPCRWPVNLLGFLVVACTFLVIACGPGEAGPRPQHATPETPTTVPESPTPLATPSPPAPTEFRVAFINLFSPLAAEAGNPAAGETFEVRLQLLVEQLRSFDPDVVGFNEASWTEKYGSATTYLARELKMEPVYARANPWFEGQTREQSDALVREAGFEEGELFLVRSTRYTVLRADEPYALKPLSTESGERRIGLHAVLKGPKSLGEIDLFITHLTGGGERVVPAQAADFAGWIAETRGRGPSLVMVGQSDPAVPSSYEVFRAIGLRDVFGAGEGIVTCCRAAVVDEQPPLSARTDYLMYDRWQAGSAELFGDQPLENHGSLLYLSDHNGIMAIFPIPPERAGAIP